jgi:putative DNA primase/helicase
MDGQGNVRHISPFPAVCGYLTTGGPELGLGMLDQIVNVPVFAPDGTLCTDQGYHRECGSYLYTKGQEFLEVSADPTEAEVDAAWDWLMETIRDFPFSDDFSGNDPLPVRVPGEVDADGFPVPNLGRGRSSRAHWMAMFLQPFARNLIDGPTPAYLIDKSMPGTGAGYLANTLGYALTGRPMTPETPPANGEEFHKTITASLRNGPQVMFLDNINFKLDSGALAAALTSGQWRGRILGQTEMVDVPVRCTWIMAANQGSFSRELMRRVVPIRLDAAVPDPARDRKKDWYKHQDINQFLNTNRTTLVWAAHTIIQAWLVAGRPGYAGEPLQSFNEWSRVMGGILEFHGMEGFLENVTDYLNDRVDEGDDLRDYVERLVGTVGVGSEWTADDAYSAATHPLRPDAIDPALGLNLGAGPESTVRQRLYQKLSESVGKVWDVPLPGHAEARIQLTKRRTKKGNRYTLVELK